MRADRTSSGPDDLESVRARRGVPKTRQYAASSSLLLSSRVPCLRCLFVRTNSQETFENRICTVREIRFFVVIFSQPGNEFLINPNIS